MGRIEDRLLSEMQRLFGLGRDCWRKTRVAASRKEILSVMAVKKIELVSFNGEYPVGLG